MITNLFSSFDPSSSIILFPNWYRLFIPLIFIPGSFWLSPNTNSLILNNVKSILHSEIKILLGALPIHGRTLFFFVLFVFILFNNSIGLFPFIFTGTSHIVTTFSLALPLWLSFILLGWVNYTNSIFAHLVPQGTPSALISFIVIIETISNTIRPGTLAVRLSANIIAGHLLLTLLGNQTAAANNLILASLISTQIALLVLETAVAIIQAYVFLVLTSLYLSESSPH